MDLSNLKASSPNRKRRRVGRGEASGWGKTSGRGHKGQKARSGGKVSPGFEGGQMPLQRRIPKKGFRNLFKVIYNLVHVKDLEKLEPGTTVTEELLREKGMIRRGGPVKLLADGDVSTAYTIRVNRVSASARAKIEAAGGSVEEVQ
ncbi:MAG: 50S ribosomal protein L15 [Thermodesulfobacteriota bacterium]